MSDVSTIRLTSTTEQRIVEALRERILAGEFGIGERLRQDTIGDELGVSSTPVREAFRRLEAEGLLTIASHKGAIVRSLSETERVEVLEILRLIESHNLATAIPAATPDTVAMAAEVQNELRRTTDSSRWAMLNRRFHLTLAAPSGKPRALALLTENLNLSALQIRDDIGSIAGQRDAALAEHDAILSAYAEGDVCACQRAARLHTTNALERLLA